MANTIELLRPSPTECQKYLDRTKLPENEHYTVQGKATEKLFSLFPKNTTLEEVILKVAVLNKFYINKYSRYIYCCKNNLLFKRHWFKTWSKRFFCCKRNCRCSKQNQNQKKSLCFCFEILCNSQTFRFSNFW